MNVEEKQINLQQNISKLGSINMSHIELISNDQPTSDPKIGSSLRFGDNRRRMLLEENSSPIQPKIDIQNEIIHNPSNNSFFKTKKVQSKLDDSPKKNNQALLALQNLQSSPTSQISPFKNSPDLERISHIQSQLNNEIGPSKYSALNIAHNPKPRLSLQVSLMAKRFAQKFKLKSSSVLFQKLTDKQFKIIGDLSFSIRQHKQIMNSSFQIAWSIWSFIYMIALLLIVPVKFCMDINILSFYEALIALAIVFMLINIGIQMNQGSQSKSENKSLRTTFKRGDFGTTNLFSYLILTNILLNRIDLIILLTYLISMGSEDHHFLRLSIIVKIGYVIDMYDKIQNMMEIKQKYKQYGVFLKIFFQILLIAHLAGCFFIKIGLNNRDEVNWIRTLKIDYEDYQTIYTSAIYWSVITMITVGYGDITPTNINEKTYVIFVSLISCGIFGYSLNTIGYILKEKEESKIQFQNKINDLSNFMKKRQVTRDIREKVFKYFHYCHKEEIHENSKVYTMINELPESILNNFLVELYHGMLRELPFFKSTFSDSFLLQLCSLVKEIKIGPDMNLNDVEKLCEGNSIPLHEKFFFIMKGKVSYQTNSKKERLIKIYEKGECFGLAEFISGQTSGINPTYKTRSVTVLAYINKSEFLQILDQNPSEKENFFMIRDKISFNNNIELNKLRCLACQNENHSVHICERLHMKPNVDRIIYQYNSSKTQERNPVRIERRDKRILSPYFYVNWDEEQLDNDQFEQVKKDYVTQYTSHQTISQHNIQQQQYLGQRHQSSQSNVSFQVRENTISNIRLNNKRKKTNQSTVIREESIDNRKPKLKIKEYKGQNSLSNSANDQDLLSVQNRSKRSHSELQFQFLPEQVGSHQILAYLSPRNGTNQPSSQNNNQISMTNLAVSHNLQSNTHTISTFVNPSGMSGGNSGLESSQHPQQSIKEMNIPRNDIYFNKEDIEGSQYKEDEGNINQSFNSLYRKRNVQKKQSKKLKGSAAIFNMDEIKIKKNNNGIITLSNKQVSQTFLPDIQQALQEDQQTSSANTYNQISNMNISSSTNIQNPLNNKIAELSTAIQNNNNNYNEYIQDSNPSRQFLDYEDEIEEEGQQKSQIQLFHTQIIQLKESKVFDLDEKRQFEIYFPNFNSEIIIQKLQKQIITQILRSPMKHNRKASKFKNTLMTPLAFGKKSDVSSLQTRGLNPTLKLYL